MGEVRPQIPKFISAATPLGLQRQMLLVNTRARLVFNFYSIQFVNGRWYAWYYDEIRTGDGAGE